MHYLNHCLQSEPPYCRLANLGQTVSLWNIRMSNDRTDFLPLVSAIKFHRKTSVTEVALIYWEQDSSCDKHWRSVQFEVLLTFALVGRGKFRDSIDVHV